MVELKNVTKTYPDGTKALKNVDLTINDGEFVFIVGHSGAGKTTFTKLLLGEEKATSGSVMVEGYDLKKIKKWSVHKLRRHLGVVFQDFRLLPNMTVYENVAFAMNVTSTPKKIIKLRVGKFLEFVGLSDKANSYPAQLSGGERQRVAIARALVNNPSVIIADEPTGNIDVTMSKKIMDLLFRINSLGKTVIVVTHDKSIVDEYNQRVVTFSEGNIVSDRIGGMFGEQEEVL